MTITTITLQSWYSCISHKCREKEIWKRFSTDSLLKPVACFFGLILNLAAAISFLSSQRRRSKPSNFAIFLAFLILKTYKKISFSKQAHCTLTTGFSGPKRFRDSRETGPRGPFLESPKTFLSHFEWHNSLFIFKTKASRSRKLYSYVNFDSLYNM